MPMLAAVDAVLACDQGSAPSGLGVFPTSPPITAVKELAADIDDYKPAVNVRPFGMCSSIKNPAVAAATAENEGVLKPMPCTPMPGSQWSKSSVVTLRGVPALHEGCTVSCNFGGTITLKSAAQSVVNVR